MKTIKDEGILSKERFNVDVKLDKAEVQNAFNYITKKLDKSMEMFTHKFPAPASDNNVYRAIDNTDWTASFYTGMLWLAYEMTGEEKYKNVAKIHTQSFKERAYHGDVDTHDLGFLYTLSCVADYKLTGDTEAKDIAVKAADLMLNRWKEKGSFIQAWGKTDDLTKYRFIIDCLMNLPLLYWASEVTGNLEYAIKAYRHLNTTVENIVREDASAFHTFYMNPETGEPDHGETHQGYSDTSCWARGQAWAVYGLPLSYKYTKDPIALEVCNKMTNYYLNRLPEDFIPYWDLIFTSGTEERDSSAAAIAVCGLLELIKYTDDDELKKIYKNAAYSTLKSLIENYTTKETAESNGILLHGVYNKNGGTGVDECVLWGDYYYAEALVRCLKDWELYW